jgi:hypothetical protein
MNKTSYINEKSNPIQIKKISVPNKNDYLDTEYGLKKNFFDPFKSSPPNEFMLKLNMRCFLHHKNKCNLDTA